MGRVGLCLPFFRPLLLSNIWPPTTNKQEQVNVNTNPLANATRVRPSIPPAPRDYQHVCNMRLEQERKHRARGRQMLLAFATIALIALVRVLGPLA